MRDRADRPTSSLSFQSLTQFEVLLRRVCFSASLGLFVGLMTGCASMSDAQLVSVGAEYWDAQVGGALQTSEITADSIDLDDTLALGGEKVWVYHASASLGSTQLEAYFIDIGSNGLSTLASDIDFGGETFSSGSDILSSLDTSVLQLHTESGVFNWSVVRFGFIAGIDQLNIDATLVDDGALISASQDYDDWIPVIGVSAAVNVPIWEMVIFADGAISGITEDISLDTFDGDYLSSWIRAGVNLDDGFKVGLGYRSLDADFQDSGNDFDVDLGGGFLFIDIDF